MKLRPIAGVLGLGLPLYINILSMHNPLIAIQAKKKINKI